MAAVSAQSHETTDGLDEFCRIVTYPILKHYVYLFDVLDIPGRIAVNHHEIRLLACCERADFGRFAQIPAGTGFRFKAVDMAEAQAEAKAFAKQLASLPDRVSALEVFDLNIEALQHANVAGSAVSAVDAGTWHALTGE